MVFECLILCTLLNSLIKYVYYSNIIKYSIMFIIIVLKNIYILWMCIANYVIDMNNF